METVDQLWYQDSTGCILQVSPYRWHKLLHCWRECLFRRCCYSGTPYKPSTSHVLPVFTNVSRSVIFTWMPWFTSIHPISLYVELSGVTSCTSATTSLIGLVSGVAGTISVSRFLFRLLLGFSIISKAVSYQARKIHQSNSIYVNSNEKRFHKHQMVWDTKIAKELI